MLYKCLIAARKVLNVSDLAKEILLIHLVEVSWKSWCSPARAVQVESQPFQVIGYRATDQRHGMACHILQLVFLCLWHCSVHQGTGFGCFRTLGDSRDSLWLAHNCHPTGLWFETGSLARIMKCYPHPCAPSSKVRLCPSQSEIKTMSVPHILLVLFESPPASWPKIKWHGSVSSFNGTIANAGSVGSIGRYCPAFDMQTMATFTWYRSNRSLNEAYLWSQRTRVWHGLTRFVVASCNAKIRVPRLSKWGPVAARLEQSHPCWCNQAIPMAWALSRSPASSEQALFPSFSQEASALGRWGHSRAGEPARTAMEPPELVENIDAFWRAVGCCHFILNRSNIQKLSQTAWCSKCSPSWAPLFPSLPSPPLHLFPSPPSHPSPPSLLQLALRYAWLEPYAAACEYVRMPSD